MPTINERPRKNAPSSWQAIIRVKGQPSISRSFDDRAQAERFAIEAERSLRAQATRQFREHAALRKVNPTFADFQQETLCDTLAQFAKSGRATTRHSSNMPTIVANIGQVRLGDIRRSWVDAYLAKMRTKKSRVGKPFKWATLAVHMQLMALAIRWRAESLDLPAPSLPFSTKLLPDNWETHRERRLSNVEEMALMATIKASRSKAKHHWRLIVRLALETGARLQELVLAEWSEFDIARRLWTIPAIHTKCKKTRAIPLSFKAIRVMRLLKLLAISGEIRVFHPISSPSSASTGFHVFSLRAGLEDFRFHDLRHEAISRMVLYKRKLSVFEIMAIVGHSSTEMLMRYANLRGDELAHRMD